ncbi:hypothetical protein KM043_007076 [Ampulex compressa]|nr:hypothetical protein KM043_007076 [Ampulex compressa]
MESRKQCAHTKQCYGAATKLREDRFVFQPRFHPRPTTGLTCLVEVRLCSTDAAGAAEFHLRKTMPSYTTKAARNDGSELWPDSAFSPAVNAAETVKLFYTCVKTTSVYPTGLSLGNWKAPGNVPLFEHLI